MTNIGSTGMPYHCILAHSRPDFGGSSDGTGVLSHQCGSQGFKGCFVGYVLLCFALVWSVYAQTTVYVTPP